jgi:hypothetical protein
MKGLVSQFREGRFRFTKVSSLDSGLYMSLFTTLLCSIICSRLFALDIFLLFQTTRNIFLLYTYALQSSQAINHESHGQYA